MNIHYFNFAFIHENLPGLVIGINLLDMKGEPKIIEKLNALLADEMTAISQYIIHAEMCANWGCKKLHDQIKVRAITEMKHAEKLIERVIFLEGTPKINVLNEVNIGENIEEQFKNDCRAEELAVKAYNDNIRLAMELGDHGTAYIMRSILMEEEGHLDWLEMQLEMIRQLQLKNYLMEQMS
jgi:bacterioferritin